MYICICMYIYDIYGNHKNICSIDSDLSFGSQFTMLEPMFQHCLKTFLRKSVKRTINVRIKAININ